MHPGRTAWAIRRPVASCGLTVKLVKLVKVCVGTRKALVSMVVRTSGLPPSPEHGSSLSATSCPN
jgi:hypothetical protein